MGFWSNGVLEYWVLNASLYYSITPVIQSSLYVDSQQSGASGAPIPIAFDSLPLQACDKLA